MDRQIFYFISKICSRFAVRLRPSVVVVRIFANFPESLKEIHLNIVVILK